MKNNKNFYRARVGVPVKVELGETLTVGQVHSNFMSTHLFLFEVHHTLTDQAFYYPRARRSIYRVLTGFLNLFINTLEGAKVVIATFIQSLAQVTAFQIQSLAEIVLFQSRLSVQSRASASSLPHPRK